MAWTPAHQALLEDYAAFAGMPTDDEDARGWTMNLAEQFAFSFPTEGWGTKQADPSRPPSTDVICTLRPFIGYDVLINQGQPSQALATNPGPLNLEGQVFIPVTPADHLGGEPQPEPGLPPYPGDEVFDQIGVVLFADYAQAGQAPNPGMGRWFGRTVYDYLAGMSMEDSIERHRDEWRAVLGLPPL